MKEKVPTPYGRGRIFQANLSADAKWFSNLILYDFGFLAGKQLFDPEINYRIAVMYIEFENTADPEDEIVLPTVEREDGIDYYNALLSDPIRDYLRVPIFATSSDKSDDSLYANNNRWTIFARTTGVLGVHGKAFSNASNSKVFGAAVVAAVNSDDPTQDILMSRFYVEGSEQQLKLATSQISAEYQVTFP